MWKRKDKREDDAPRSYDFGCQAKANHVRSSLEGELHIETAEHRRGLVDRCQIEQPLHRASKPSPPSKDMGDPESYPEIPIVLPYQEHAAVAGEWE